MEIKGEITPLHRRAKQLLINYFDQLADGDRDYMVSLESRKIIFGTPFQQQRVSEIENKFAT